MTPRIQSTLPEIRNLLLRAARRPSRLAIWFTAAIAAVVMAVSACAALPAVSVTGMAGSNHAKNVGDSGQDGAPAAAAQGSARSASAAADHTARHAGAGKTGAGHRSHHAPRVHEAADKGQKLHPRKAAVSHARHGTHRTAVKARTVVRHRVRHSRGHSPGLHAAMRPAVHHGASHREHVSHDTGTPAKPYLIYDSVTPGAIPAGRAAAVYSTGPYAAQPSEVAGHSRVVWIDTRGSNPGASALDVEPGDATPAVAADWARRRLIANPHGLARIYTMRSEWASVQAAVSSLSSWMRSRIRYWIADPTGTPHIVPGSDATQWYWGKSYDITTATPRF